MKTKIKLTVTVLNEKDQNPILFEDVVITEHDKLETDTPFDALKLRCRDYFKSFGIFEG